MSDQVETDYNGTLNGTFYVEGPHKTQITKSAASGLAQTLFFASYTASLAGVHVYEQAESVFDITLSDNCALTFAPGTALGIFQRLTLVLRQPASGSTFTATLPSNVNYPSGSPPAVSTAAGSATVITFTTPDNGATIFAIEAASFPGVVTSVPASMVQFVSATVTAAGNLTLTLPAAPKAGNHALLFVGNYGSNGNPAPATPAGWTLLQGGDAVASTARVTVFSAPVSALVSNGVTVAMPGGGGAYLVETTAAVFPDSSVGTASVSGQTLTVQPVAASKAGGDRYVMAAGYQGNYTYPWTGAGVLSSTDSNGGSPYTVLIAVPASSTGTVSAITGTQAGSLYNGAFASVNGYAS